MRKRWLALFVTCLLAAFAGAELSRAQQPPAAPDARYVTVKYDRPQARAIRAFGERPPTLAEDGWAQVEVPPGKTAREVVAELTQDPAVLSAEPAPSGSVVAAFTPNDPYYDTNGPSQVAYMQQINAPAAWDLTTGDDDVVVAVLDSGLDLAHPEFAGHLWENPGDANSNGIDDDHNGCVDDRYGCRFINLTPERATLCGYTASSSRLLGGTAIGAVLDDHYVSPTLHSHGTMVTGILGATGNNGLGLAGIAWNVRLMPIKVLDCGKPKGGLPGGDPGNLAEGIDYAVEMGADIINLSLAADQDFQVIREAVARAQAAGVIVVSATGNLSPGSSDVGVWYPAAYTQYPNVIAVGATDNRVSGTSWAPYSRYGPPVDFAAPAADLITAARSDLGFATPYFTTGMGGTSFATPVVAGVFALLKSRDPVLTPAEYIQFAREAATPATPAPHGQNWAGSGIINAGGAVARVPMHLTGEALADWNYVPPGTEVRALVDGNTCGTTNVGTATGVISLYDIRVRADGQQPGCGAPGRTVQLYVGGAPAQPPIPWGGQNQPLVNLDFDVSSVTPPPGAVVVQALNGGMSNIAVLDNSGELPNVLSSVSGWQAVYRWDPAAEGFTGPGAYDRYAREAPDFVNSMDSLATYEAVWIDAPAGNVAMLNPNPPSSRTIGLQPGWNNFVYTGTNKEVKDALASIAGKYTVVLRYDNPSFAWRIHVPGQARYLNDFGGLFKFQAYWVYMTQPGALTMD